MRTLVPDTDHGWDADFAVPSGRGFIALLEAFRASGGTAPGAVMDRLLEEHRVGHAVSLARLIRAGQVFGFEWRASLWIPMFQFEADDLSPKIGAQRARAELPALWSGWTLACWFSAPNARLDGRSPADLLDSKLDAVIRAAKSLESVDEIAPPRVRRAQKVDAHV